MISVDVLPAASQFLNSEFLELACATEGHLLTLTRLLWADGHVSWRVECDASFRYDANDRAMSVAHFHALAGGVR